MKKNVLKTAVSGLGRVAWQYHLPLLAADPAFQLVAAADPLADRRREAESGYPGINTYPDCATMLEKEAPDLLVVASPTPFHMDQTLDALARGCDVFCEKPLAVSFEQALRIRRCAETHHRKLMVYQPHRVLQEFPVLRRIIDSGRLGQVFLSNRTFRQYNRRNDWQSRLDCGGGMLCNYGAHFIDQFLAMFGGAPLAVDGVTLMRSVGIGDAEDVVSLNLRNAQNVIGRIEINLGSAFPEDSWTVYGTCGTARFDNSDRRWLVRSIDPGDLVKLELQSSMAATGRRYSQESAIEWREDTFPLPPSDRKTFYEEVKRYFRDDLSPLVPLADTMEVMRVISECRKHPVLDLRQSAAVAEEVSA